MIGSKEQYERLLANSEHQKFMPIQHVELFVETIEALQEVAKAVENERSVTHTLESVRNDPELVGKATNLLNNARMRTNLALDALSDWITEDG